MKGLRNRFCTCGPVDVMGLKHSQKLQTLYIYINSTIYLFTYLKRFGLCNIDG